MSTRVLETVLTGRDLLSPVLGKAGASVAAFNTQVAGSSARAGVAATAGAGVQDGAATKIVAANTKASSSAAASASSQARAHARAAESATASARVQQSANNALARSNGLLGTSLTPLTAGLGATALALGYAGYRGMEFDSAMSQVQAASQETGATLGQMRDAAVDAGAKTQYSAVEAAQGITEMSKAGVSAKDILGGGLTGALNLAAAGQIDVAEAAETGATALSVFNLKGNQMSHVADLLAAGAGKAQGSVGDLSAALNQSALVASQTGLSIEDTAGALAMFASNGLVGSDAGTSFKTMLQALTPNSVAASKAMDAIGFSAYDSQGKFIGLRAVAGQLKTGLAGLTEEQRNSTLETIFGSDAVRAAAVLYKEGSAGVATWAGNVDDAGYAARQAAQLTDNLSGDLERAGGALDALFTTVGGGAQGPLRLLVQGFTGLVNILSTVIGFVSDLPGPVMAGVVALTALMLINGPLAGAIGRSTLALASWYGSAVTAAGATGILGAAMTGLRGAAAGTMALMGGPLGLAIVGVTVGLGFLVSAMSDSEEATDDAAASQSGLAQALMQSKGALDANVRAAAAKEARDAGLLDMAKTLHIPLSQVTDAILGQGNALNEVGTKFLAYRDARVWGSDADKQAAAAANESYQALLELAGQTEGNIVTAQDLAAATAQTGAAMAATTALTEEQIQAQEDWLNRVGDLLTGFTDPLSVYTGLLDTKTSAERSAAEATAAATEDSSDSWKDYVSDVGVSLDEYATKLEEQLTAQANWRDNIVRVTQRGGMEVGQILLDMGEEGVQLTADMANGTDAEFQRMAALLIRDARAGGTGAATALDSAMKVMQIVGRDGARATRSQIAKELGIGVGEVQAIADKYGVALATGINPVLAAIGKRAITINQQAGRRYIGVNEYAGGGFEDHAAQIAMGGPVRVWAEPETGGESYIPLSPAKRARSLAIWRETGKRLDAPEAEFFAAGGFSTAADVPRPYSTAPFRVPLSTAADGVMAREYADVTAWMRANAEAVMGGGPAGAGAIGGGWAAVFNYVKARIPQARANSTFRLGDPGYHGKGKAVDFGFGSGPGGAGSAGLASINRLLHDNIGKNLAELIYDGIGDDRPDLKNGRPLTYSASTRDQHRNHVHAAVYDQGGPLPPGYTLAYNGTGKTEWVSTAPAAQPGYGQAASAYGGSHVVVEKRTEIAVDASNRDHRGIALAISRQQREDDWLTGG